MLPSPQVVAMASSHPSFSCASCSTYNSLQLPGEQAWTPRRNRHGHHHNLGVNERNSECVDAHDAPIRLYLNSDVATPNAYSL